MMRYKILLSCILGIVLSACEEDPENRTKVYDISISNITSNQVLTPPAIFLHEGKLNVWRLGKSASAGLEVLAETGNPNDLIGEHQARSATTAMGDGVITAGNSFSLQLTVEADEELALSLASMLALTNDGFTGVDSWNIGHLSVGGSKSVLARVFDAGTEANTESANTVPGLGGTDFDGTREARDTVVIHPGVVSQDDGLTSSGLNSIHRFLNYAALIQVKRVE